MALHDGGDLFDRLVNVGPYSEDQARRHMMTLGLALEFIHDKGVIHRDLKPENILLTSNEYDAEIMIADFGHSKMVDDIEREALHTICGTLAYSAPEMSGARAGAGGSAIYTAKVDTWSCGVIMYMILCGWHPFDYEGTATECEMWHNINTGTFEFNHGMWNTVSAEACDLINHLIVVEPAKRYNVQEMLNHPWFTT